MYLKMSLFQFCFWKMFFAEYRILDWQFSFSPIALKLLLHCWFACIVSDEKSVVIFIFVPLYILCLFFFSWLLLRLPFSQWFEEFDYYVIDVVCLVFLLGFTEHLGLVGVLFLSNLGKSGHYLFKYFSIPFPSSSRNSNYICVRLLSVPTTHWCGDIWFPHPFFFGSFWIVSFVVSSNSLIFYLVFIYSVVDSI